MDKILILNESGIYPLPNCTVSYIGQTARKFLVILKEHSKAFEKFRNSYNNQNSQYVFVKHIIEFNHNSEPSSDVEFLHFHYKSSKLTLVEN